MLKSRKCKIEKICFGCGNQFLINQSLAKRRPCKFCSRACFDKHREVPKKECIICGKTYNPTKKTTNVWQRSKYCSRWCFRLGKLTGEIITCDYCGNEIWRSRSILGKHNYCSEECYYKAKKGIKNQIGAEITRRLYKEGKLKPWNKGMSGFKHSGSFQKGHTLTKGPNHPSWNGGVCKTSNGYTRVYNPDHLRADCDGYVLEHVLVMEQKIGRPIEIWERVHHIDFDKKNNSEENLYLFGSDREHCDYHAMLRCFVREMLKEEQNGN